jgi:condensin complex subunit 1
LLSEHPDEICTDMLRTKIASIFKSNAGDEVIGEELASQEMEQKIECMTSPYELSQLMFLAGHVAIKQIVHLELIEVELKRRKNEESGW